MKPKKAEIGFLREAFLVRRYHTVLHVHMPETLGHHTANVIAIIFWLYDDNPPLHVVKHALHHDVPELLTGDVPAPTKWSFPDIDKALDQAENHARKAANLTTEEIVGIDLLLLKFADMADLCFKAVEEIASGNSHFMPVIHNGIEYCGNMLKNELKNHQPAMQLFNFIKNNPFVKIEEIEHGHPATPTLQ